MITRKNLLSLILLFIAAGISFNLLAQQKTVHLKMVANGKNSDSVYTVTIHDGTGNSSRHNLVRVYHANDITGSGNGSDSIFEVRLSDSENESDDNNGKNIVMIRHSRGDENDEEMEDEGDNFPMIYTGTSCTCSSKCCDGDSSSRSGMRKKIFMYMDENGEGAPVHRKMRYVISNDNGQAHEMEERMENIPLTVRDTTIMHVSPQGDTIKIHRKVVKDGKVEQEVMINRHSKDTSNANFFTNRVRPDKNRMYFRSMRPGRHGVAGFDLVPPMSLATPGADLFFESNGRPEGIDENTDFGKIKVTPLPGTSMVRISLDLSGKETTVIKVKDEKGKSIFEEKVKDLTGRYVRDIDMGNNVKGNFNLSIDRGKSSLTKSFSY